METVMGMDMTIREIKTANTANFVMLAIILLIMCIFIVILCVVATKIAQKKVPETPIVDTLELERLTSGHPVNAYDLSSRSKTMVFDLEGARTYFARRAVNNYPNDLDKIDMTKSNVLPTNITEVYPFFDNLSTGMMYVIREQYAISEKMRYTLEAPWRKRNILRVITIVERLLVQVSAMDKETFFANPYNWMWRAIKFLEVCSLYLLSAEPVHYQMVANDLIPKILIDCEHLSRNQETPILMPAPLAIMSLLPWMLSKLYQSVAYNTIVHDDHYNAVLQKKQLLPVVNLQNGNGRRYDQSYVFGKTARFDVMGLLNNDMARAHFANDLIIRSYNLKLPLSYVKQMQSVVHHKNIEIRTPGLFGLQKKLNGGSTPSASPFGIRVIPTLSYLRYYTPKYAFAVRAAKMGQTKFMRNILVDNLSDAELRSLSTRSGYYWEHYRGLLSTELMSEQYRFKFPEYGFVSSNDNNELIIDSAVPGTFSTTTDPTGSFEMLLAQDTEQSFVLAAKNYGIFYYVHAALIDPEAKVHELIVCDTEAQTIVHTIRIVPNTNSETSLAFYGINGQSKLSVYPTNLQKYTITSDVPKKYQTTFNFKNETVDTRELNDAAFEWPLRLNDQLTVHMNDNVASIRENNGKSSVKVLVATYINLPEYAERAIIVANIDNGSSDNTNNNDDATTSDSAAVDSASKQQLLIVNPLDSYQYSTNTSVVS